MVEVEVEGEGKNGGKGTVRFGCIRSEFFVEVRMRCWID